MIVQKFGGTSVKDAKALERLIQIVGNNTENTILVVSAISGITNQLELMTIDLKLGKPISNSFFNKLKDQHIQIANYFNLNTDVSEELNDKIFELEKFVQALCVVNDISLQSIDTILSYGELLSSRLIYHILVSQNIDIEWVNAKDIIICQTSGEIKTIDFDRSQQNYHLRFNENKNYICPGFIAATERGQTTTLGRGGSDYSASIFAYLSNAVFVEIWTDVNGVMTTNPKIVSEALSVKKLTYKEAAELAFFGAKVLHPQTIVPAEIKQIPVIVKNSMNPSFPGTEIGIKTNGNHLIKGISSKNNVTMINIMSNRMLGAHGFLSKVFSVFEHYKVSIDLIATSEVSISLTLDKATHIIDIKNELVKFSKVDIFEGMTTISIIGEGVKYLNGLAADVFNCLRNYNVFMISQGASEVNISFVLDGKDEVPAIDQLHHHFFNTNVSNSVFYRD